MDEKAIQDAYDNRICSRDPQQVVQLFAETGIVPDKDNLAKLLAVSNRVQECFDIRFSDRAPVETRFLNIYFAFKGVGIPLPDLVEQYKY